MKKVLKLIITCLISILLWFIMFSLWFPLALVWIILIWTWIVTILIGVPYILIHKRWENVDDTENKIWRIFIIWLSISSLLIFWFIWLIFKAASNF